MDDLTFAFRSLVETLGGWIYETPATSPLAFGAAAAAGLLMGLTPTTLPLVPVVFGYVLGEGQATPSYRRSRGLSLAAAFVLGVASVDAAIGFLFGLLGYYVARLLQAYLSLTNLLIAVGLAIMGLALLRVIRLRLPVPRPKLRQAGSLSGAYLLGMPFGVAICPACTPLVLPILAAAAATGSAVLSAGLLFVFGLGRGIPVLIAGTTAGALKHFERSSGWVRAIERGGGVILIITAFYFAYQSATYAYLVPPISTL